MVFDQLAQQFVTNKTNNKVFDLYTRLAGDKFETMKPTVESLVNEQGKSFGRALADALETHKVV